MSASKNFLRMNSIARTLTMSLGTAAAVVFVIALAMVVVLEYSQDTIAAQCNTASQVLQESLVIAPDGRLSIRDTGVLRALASANTRFWYAVSVAGHVVESDPARRPKLPFDLASPGPADGESDGRQGSLCLAVEHDRAKDVIIMSTGVQVSFWRFTVEFLSRGAFEILVTALGFAALAGAGTLMSAHFVARSIKRVTRLAMLIDPMEPRASISLETVPAELRALITALNRAFDEINAYVLRQRRFIGNAAHELRTPLTLLRTKIEDVPDPRIKTELIRDIRRLTSLVAAMLDLAQLQAETVNKQLVDLGALAREVLADLAPSALNSGIELSFEARCEEPVFIWGVEAALRSAIANIIGNALLHATGAKSVATVLDGREVTIVDDGVGLQVGQEQAMAEPFVKGEGSKGTAGLGLSIVKEIMMLHGGGIDLRRAPQRGTSVTLHFDMIGR